jgi:hypothetical protein
VKVLEGLKLSLKDMPAFPPKKRIDEIIAIISNAKIDQAIKEITDEK